MIRDLLTIALFWPAALVRYCMQDAGPNEPVRELEFVGVVLWWWWIA